MTQSLCKTSTQAILKVVDLYLQFYNVIAVKRHNDQPLEIVGPKF